MPDHPRNSTTVTLNLEDPVYRRLHIEAATALQLPVREDGNLIIVTVTDPMDCVRLGYEFACRLQQVRGRTFE